MTYYVFGYYNKHNLGDEAYKSVLPQFLSGDVKYIDSVDNLSIDDLNKSSGLIFGGGDIVNDYFHSEFKHVYSSTAMKIGLSVGLPVPDLVHAGYIDHLDHIFVRNKDDLEILEKRIGSQYVHYMPDIAFSFPAAPQCCLVEDKRVGVFPISHMKDSDIKMLAMSIKPLLKTYKVILYRFDCSNTSEDDMHTNLKIQQLVPEVVLDNTKYTVEEMLVNIGKLSGALCVRLHSHIFCTMLRLPFVSFGNLRKVQLFLKDNNLEHLHHSKIKHIQFDFQMPKICPLFNFDQIRNLFASGKKRLNTCPLTVDKVFDSTVNLIRDKYKVDMTCTPLIPPVATFAAQHVSFSITNNPESKYLYGLCQDLYERKNLRDMIMYIMKDFHSDTSKNVSPNGKSSGLNVKYIDQQKGEKVHRSGWNYVLDHLEKYNDPKSIMVDTFIDRTFHWCEESLLASGILPYTNRWIGFVHHTDHDNAAENGYSVTNLFKKKSFLESLETCKCLVVLSDYLNYKVTEMLMNVDRPNVAVVTLYHPTEFSKKLFDFKNFKGDLIQIGAWMRDPLAIFKLKTVFKKKALKGSDMDNYFPPKNGIFFTNKPVGNFLRVCESVCRAHCSSVFLNSLSDLIISGMENVPANLYLTDQQQNLVSETKVFGGMVSDLLSSVQIVERLTDSQYDDLLTSHVVFVKLFDASAVNTLIECVVRNTPICINKLPAVVEILGDKYPLYFDTLEDATNKLKYDIVLRAHRYLCQMDKTQLKIETFVDKFFTIQN